MILYDKENNEVCKMAYPIEPPVMQSKSVITLQREDNRYEKEECNECYGRKIIRLWI